MKSISEQKMLKHFLESQENGPVAEKRTKQKEQQEYSHAHFR